MFLSWDSLVRHAPPRAAIQAFTRRGIDSINPSKYSCDIFAHAVSIVSIYITSVANKCACFLDSFGGISSFVGTARIEEGCRITIAGGLIAAYRKEVEEENC
jgi:hypothetical protein